MTERHGRRTGSWKTMPTFRLGRITGSPAILTSPEVGGMIDAMILRSVLFPQPEGPTIVTNSPSRMSVVTSLSASTTAPFCVRNRFPTLRSSMMDERDVCPCRGNVTDGSYTRDSHFLLFLGNPVHDPSSSEHDDLMKEHAGCAKYHQDSERRTYRQPRVVEDQEVA